jgi:hypothetical protein
VLTLVLAVSAVLVWRRRPLWQPGTVRAVRRAGNAIRQLVPGDGD